MTSDGTHTCIDCKHFAQGETCSFCANDKQTDNDKKEYVYYSFSCDLFENGIHALRVKYAKTKLLIK